MSNAPQPSHTRSVRSRQGFQPLPTDQYSNTMAYSNDATIDIPLEHINSSGSGLRSKNSMPISTTQQSVATEKRRLFRGRRQRPVADTMRPKIGYDGEEDTLTTMGRIYRKILNFSVVTRYFIYISPIALLIAIPVIIGATAAQGAKIDNVRIVWFFTWVEIVWLSLWVSKIFAHYLPVVFQVLVGVVNSGIRKYALVLRALEIPVSLVGWAVTSLATFLPMMTQNPTNRNGDSAPREWMYVVQNILAAAVVSSIIFLVEKLIIQVISINYHRKQFSSRIKDSKHNIFLLSLLYEASVKLFPAYCNEFAEEDYAIADQLNLGRSFGSKTGRSRLSGSHTPLRMIQDIGRYGDKLTSAFGNIAHEVTGREVFNPGSAHSIVIEALERKRTSEALARRIWMSFVVEGHEALTHDDLVEVLGAARESEAEEAFAVLDGDSNGDISLDEMILTVVELGRERKSVANSMHDVDQAINVLDRLLIAVVLLAVILVFVAFLNTSFVTTLATTGTALLSLSFVFATSAQEVLGSCIFLFVKHPYDIGDRVDIGLDQYVVEHISLLYTVFRRVTGSSVGRIVQIPNISLNSLAIENVSRSKNMTEQLHMLVSFDTSFEDVQILKRELHKFVTDKENSRDFQPTFDIEVLGTSDMSKLELCVEIKHKSNWANETVRSARRSKFMCALVSALRAVPIYAPGGGGEAQGSAANPSYSVAISDEAAKQNVKKAADDKVAKRLIPIAKTSSGATGRSDVGTGAGLSTEESQIVSSLTSRNPAVDTARDEAWTSSKEDTSTLGRPSIDHGDVEDMRGLLRRESTRGKRKAGAVHVPGVPTIIEPSSAAYLPYQSQQPFGSSPYASTPPYQPTPSAAGRVAQQASGPQYASDEVDQASHAQRNRSESVSRKPLSPPAVPEDEDDDDSRGAYGSARPYSGV